MKNFDKMQAFLMSRDHHEETPPNDNMFEQLANAMQSKTTTLDSRIDNLETKMSSVQDGMEKLLKVIKTSIDNNKGNKEHKENLNGKHYCWTHGWAGHKGKDCNAQKQGHKDEATLTNCLGGSTNGVPRSLLNNRN